jgi:hypothetical protein
MPPRPQQKIEKVPEGWYSRDQLQEAWGLSQSRTLELIRSALRRKEAKVKTFKVKRETGVYRIPFYQFKD